MLREQSWQKFISARTKKTSTNEKNCFRSTAMKSKPLMLLVAVLGLAYTQAERIEGYLPDSFGSPKVERAVIVEETADRPKLSAAVLNVLYAAPGMGVQVVDRNIVAKDRKPPAELQPLLVAAKDKPLPCLVLRYGSGRIAVKSLPASAEALREAIK
jgi:hypothetical protein